MDVGGEPDCVDGGAEGTGACLDAKDERARFTATGKNARSKHVVGTGSRLQVIGVKVATNVRVEDRLARKQNPSL